MKSLGRNLILGTQTAMQHRSAAMRPAGIDPTWSHISTAQPTL